MTVGTPVRSFGTPRSALHVGETRRMTVPFDGRQQQRLDEHPGPLRIPANIEADYPEAMPADNRATADIEVRFPPP